MIKLKKIVNEIKIEYKIYCDLDGVLVAFFQQIKKLFNIDNLRDLETRNSIWTQSLKYGTKFWTSMDMLDDAQELWNFIKQYDTTILSAIPYTDIKGVKENAGIGKKEWVKAHLGNVPIILTDGSKSKIKYAKPNIILIDDLESNITDWTSKGGIGILHKNSKETIQKLKEYLK